MDRRSQLHIRPGLAWEQFPDEVVAIDLDRGIYFNLTGAGAEVFRCFAEPTSIDAVAAHLATGFAAPPPDVANAIATLVGELAKNALLIPVEAEPGVLPNLPPTSRALDALVLHRHDDLQNLLFLDPVHEAADEGWPARRP